jgi:transposase-like protein
MFSMPKAFPLEFRQDVVAVARKGQAPLAQVARDFGVSEASGQTTRQQNCQTQREHESRSNVKTSWWS